MRHNPRYGIMRQLVQRGAVVCGGVFEGVLRRQVNAVLSPAVECTVRLVVRDVRARVLQDLLASLYSLECRLLFGRVRGNALDLLSVKDGVNTVDEPRSLSIRVVAIGRAFSTAVRQGRLRLVGGLFDLPVLNLGTLLAPADLPPVVGSLFVSHPTWVFVSAL
jgi:hypothetical protein